mmetsp:Transcript_12125/g.42555  ORF Transcript_12125/g.42555 Transcript_12125/m.42555 type:complete len:203 (+) Transcript_12125:452-1060(+)
MPRRGAWSASTPSRRCCWRLTPFFPRPPSTQPPADRALTGHPSRKRSRATCKRGMTSAGGSCRAAPSSSRCCSGGILTTAAGWRLHRLLADPWCAASSGQRRRRVLCRRRRGGCDGACPRPRSRTVNSPSTAGPRTLRCQRLSLALSASARSTRRPCRRRSRSPPPWTKSPSVCGCRGTRGHMAALARASSRSARPKMRSQR